MTYAPIDDAKHRLAAAVKAVGAAGDTDAHDRALHGLCHARIDLRKAMGADAYWDAYHDQHWPECEEGT